MSKRPGVSAEEKLTRMVNFFHTTNTFYNIKDLMKLVPKATGIVSQSVEDTLKNLIDDGLVKSEKEEEIQNFRTSESELERAIELESVDRIDSVERQIGLQDLIQLQTTIKYLKEELERFDAMDPERIKEKVKECQLYKSGAENWTDNLSTLAKYCRDTFMMDNVTFCEEFGLEPDFEDSIE